MKNSEFRDIVNDTFGKCLDILDKKGADYTKGALQEDPFNNFKTVAKDLGITAEQAWAVYAYKHWAAVTNYIKSGGQSESEPIEQRLFDVINYSLLLMGMIQEHKRNATNIDPSTIYPKCSGDVTIDIELKWNLKM